MYECIIYELVERTHLFMIVDDRGRGRKSKVTIFVFSYHSVTVFLLCLSGVRSIFNVTYFITSFRVPGAWPT